MRLVNMTPSIAVPEPDRVVINGIPFAWSDRTPEVSIWECDDTAVGGDLTLTYSKHGWAIGTGQLTGDRRGTPREAWSAFKSAVGVATLVIALAEAKD